MSGTCNHDVRFVPVDGSATTRRPDYTDACSKPATGRSSNGFHPRCDEHRARRHLVTVGTSFTITREVHDNERGAKLEVLGRLGHATNIPGADWALPHREELERKLESMKARPATDEDLVRFGEIATQERNRRELIATGLRGAAVAS